MNPVNSSRVATLPVVGARVRIIKPPSLPYTPHVGYTARVVRVELGEQQGHPYPVVVLLERDLLMGRRGMEGEVRYLPEEVEVIADDVVPVPG